MAEKILPNGADPLDPNLIAQMTEDAAKIEAGQPFPKTLVEKGDLVDSLIIAGLRARPFSAGVIAILEMIDAPFFQGDEDAECSIADALVLLYILLSDVSEETLVEQAASGYDKIKKAAVLWSFSVPAENLLCMKSEIPALFAKLGNTMEIYGDASENKKK